MLIITITGELTGGSAAIYELPNRQGRMRLVPTYHARALAKDVEFLFAVVRDATPQVFGELRDRYGVGGECPPSGSKPYHGLVRKDGPVGFRIQLFDEGCAYQNSLTGAGVVKRTEIQIHVGAASSGGCIMVAGPRQWYYDVFARKIDAMARNPGGVIRVVVEPRNYPAPKLHRRRS